MSSWPCIVNNEFYCKDTLFVSGDEGVSYELSESYTNAVSYAKSLPNCEVITLSKSNEDDHDITNTFSYNSQEYSYTIDFITPLEHIECKDEFEQSIFIAINYQNKTILLTGDATNANIDNYAKADHGYDVDVLITGYVSGEHKDAIRLSDNRGTDFLGDINLTEGDNAIITYYDIDQMQYLMNVIGYRHATVKPLTVFESVRTKINADGTITSTTVER